MIRPTPTVAARRRRTVLWLPIGLLGAVVALFATPSALMLAPNGAWLLGAGVALVGCIGAVLDDGKVGDR
ncbi:hypothetical protein [Tersicoccus sp. Bi-70]|uniref:hypothetical protein n=1 Tax=Tersicoccus sp. Bi-70 TaxID=1897634 RepID=UPI0009757A4C|nr:hypothetical protein [Tersicoccus sp. Bi-70]OMH30623.1 hypothetical protein BGP79_11735 [Tersicoccus sp. Bi-70]